MTTLALNKTYQSVGATLDKFSLSFPLQKSVSVYQDVIKITTDKESLKFSKNLISILNKIQDALPEKDKDVSVINLKSNLELINQNLSNVNQFFEVIDHFFNDHEQEKIIIDDPNMMQLINNMQKAKEMIIFISEYLKCVLEVHEAKKAIKDGKAKTYCFTKVDKFILAA